MSWEHETVATAGETKRRRAVPGRGWTETSCCAACRGGESSTTTVDSHGEEDKLWGSSWKRRGDRVFAQRGQLVSTATAFSREGDTDGIGRGSVVGVTSVVVAEDVGYGGGGGRGCWLWWWWWPRGRGGSGGGPAGISCGPDTCSRQEQERDLPPPAAGGATRGDPFLFSPLGHSREARAATRCRTIGPRRPSIEYARFYVFLPHFSRIDFSKIATRCTAIRSPQVIFSTVPSWSRVAVFVLPWPPSPPPRDTGGHVTQIETADLRRGTSTSVARRPRDSPFLSTHSRPRMFRRGYWSVALRLRTGSRCFRCGSYRPSIKKTRVLLVAILCLRSQGISGYHGRR